MKFLRMAGMRRSVLFAGLWLGFAAGASAQEQAATADQGSSTVAEAPGEASVEAVPVESAPAEAASDPQADPNSAAPAGDEAAAPQAEGQAQQEAAAPAAAETIPVASTAKQQQPEPEPEPELAPANTQRLEDVVVTVTKRQRSLRELPQSVSAFSGEQLYDRGATDMSEFLKYTPGVVLSDTGDGENPNVTIRGIATNSEAGVQGSRTFGIFYGDAALINPVLFGVTPSIDPFDMQSVEVLKGPQGTLFGGQALSGAIRFVPTPPDLNGTYAQVRYDTVKVAESGSLGQRYSGLANLALGETFALRFSGNFQRNAGWVDDTRSKQNDINTTSTNQGRLQMRIQPSAGLDISAGQFVSTHVQDNSARLNGSQETWEISNRRAPDTEHSRVGITDVKVEQNLSSGIGILPPIPMTVVGLFTQVRKDAGQSLDFTAGVASIVANQLDSLDTVIPGISVATILDKYLPGQLLTVNAPLTSNQTTYELRFVSTEPTGGWWPVRDWDYLLGYYHMDSDQFLRQNTTLGPGALPIPLPVVLQNALPLVPGLEVTPQGAIQPQEVIGAYTGTTTEDALFFDLTRKFDYNLELNLGGRFFRVGPKVEARSYVLNDSTLPSQEELLGGVLGNPFAALKTEDGFNPKFALTWTPSKHFSIYEASSKGYRFGGANVCLPFLCQATPYPLVYKSDTLWNHEIGIRTEWFDKTLRADATVFDIEWTNMQTQQVYRGAFAYTTNVGSSRSKGLELATQMFLPWGFSLQGNISFINARTTTSTVVNSGSVAGGGLTPDAIPAGTRLPTAPVIGSSVVLAWTQNIGTWLTAANVSWTEQSKTKAQLGDVQELDGYNSFSVGVKLAAPQLPSAPSLDLNVINLTNEFVVQGRTKDDLIKLTRPPRTITLGLTLNIGDSH